MVVHYNKATCKSGRLLNERLTELGYNGEPIIWGRDVNKREHLLKMQRAGVPVPTYQWNSIISPQLYRWY